MRGKRRKVLISDFQRKTGEPAFKSKTEELFSGTRVIAESIVRKIKKGYKKRCSSKM